MGTLHGYLPRWVFLRLFRWKIRLRYISALNKFWFASILLIVLTIPIWRFLGTDASLPVLADATPILLAIVGVVMSYVQPKKENHGATTLILICAGLVGSAILSANRIRSENSHKKEMRGLTEKIEAVEAQNTKLANFLLTSKGNVTETDRRRGIEMTLRNEYILTHDSIDPEILAGNKMPPAEWMNQRLAVLGEHWKVTPESPRFVSAPQSPPPPKPDITAAIVYPEEIALLLVNNSEAPVREITGLIALWDLDNLGNPPTPLQIPLDVKDTVIAKHTFLIPERLVGHPNVAGRIKKGDRIFGFITVGCAECVETRTFWVYAVQGVGGWYSPAENEKFPAMNAISTHIKEIAAQPGDSFLAPTVPQDKRIPIEQTVP